MTLVLLIMVRPMLLSDNLWCLCIIYHELPLYVLDSLYYYSYLFRLLEFKVKEVYTAYEINIF